MGYSVALRLKLLEDIEEFKSGMYLFLGGYYSFIDFITAAVQFVVIS